MRECVFAHLYFYIVFQTGPDDMVYLNEVQHWNSPNFLPRPVTIILHFVDTLSLTTYNIEKV